MKKVVIAGGTGFVGQRLEKELFSRGYDVYILTRSPKRPNHIQWDPAKKQIDTNSLLATDVLINLCGENIGGGRWTSRRKQELLDSRVDPTLFLHTTFQQIPGLQKYISASGINCYPLHSSKEHTENDAYGEDFVSQLVKKWENAANQFQDICSVALMRLSIVLDSEEGALQKIKIPHRFGLGSAMGSGQQIMTWVHINDAVNAFVFALENESIIGPFNITGQPESNDQFMKKLAKSLRKPYFLPAIPAFVFRLFFGEMSSLLLTGVSASRKKFQELGFEFQFQELSSAFKNLHEIKEDR